MDSFDKKFIEAIINKLKSKLERELTSEEIHAFMLQRSGLAYEMIFDYVSDDQKSKDDIEEYVKNVVAEYLSNRI